MRAAGIEPDGVLLIDKHAGVTSHDIVGKIRRLYETRAVGHAGTLDPMATGVLVVLLGRAAKACEYLTGENKHYLARLRLGMTTDTQDVTGTVLSRSDALPDRETVLSVLPRFCGEIRQLPPMYSALKVDGHKLVDLARQGVTVEREERPVTVFSLTATPTETQSDYLLDVTCSGGTYIRTLCHDIGAALGCGGVMAELRRLSACGFPIEQCVTVAKLETMSPAERISRLHPTESLFASLPVVRLSAFPDRLICNGCAVREEKLSLSCSIGTRLRLAHPDGSFFALGEIVSDPEGKPAVKAVKFFVLP